MKKTLFLLFSFLIIAAIVDHVSTTLNVPLMSARAPIKEMNESIVYLADWALQSFTVTAILIGISSLIDYLINLKFRKMSFIVPSITALLVIWRLGWGVSNLFLYLTFRGGA